MLAFASAALRHIGSPSPRNMQFRQPP